MSATAWSALAITSLAVTAASIATAATLLFCGFISYVDGLGFGQPFAGLLPLLLWLSGASGASSVFVYVFACRKLASHD
jgi:hypothetical protein